MKKFPFKNISAIPVSRWSRFLINKTDHKKSDNRIIFYDYKFISLSTRKSLSAREGRKKWPSSQIKKKSLFVNLQGVILAAFKSKSFLYILSFFLIVLLISYFILSLYFKNSVLFEADIAYEYKKLYTEETLSIGVDSERQVVQELFLEDGITISDYSTGEKFVGEYSSGAIAVFNATSEILEIKAGTEVVCISTSCNGKVYYSVDTLNLGPGSSDELKIKASDIGEDYNVQINAGRFKVGSYSPTSEVVASNIKQISGGTPKKKVNVVAEEDLRKLEARASKELESIIKSNIISDPNNSRGYLFFNDSFRMEKVFSESDGVGDEKEIVNFTLRAKGYLKAIDKSDILPRIEEIKGSMTPDGYYFDDRTFFYELYPLGTSNNALNVKVVISGIARVQIDMISLKNSLKSKPLSEALEILNNLDKVKVMEFRYNYDFLPNYLKYMPDNTDQIKIRLLALDPKE